MFRQVFRVFPATSYRTSGFICRPFVFISKVSYSDGQFQGVPNSSSERLKNDNHSHHPPKGKRSIKKKLHNRHLTEIQHSINNELVKTLSNSTKEEESFGNIHERVNKERRKKSIEKKRGRVVENTAIVNIEKEEDEFGTLVDDDELNLPADIVSEKRGEDVEPESEDDEHVPLTTHGLRGHNATWYGRQIEQLGRQAKVYEATQMLEETMLKEDRVRPNEYVFTVLIGVCGRVGYTRKAFQLFNKMKKYGLTPEAPTYTALFNACANSPWPEDGLKRANHLCRLIREKEVEPNAYTIKAMVKAYSKLGEIKTALSLMDGMVESGLGLDGEAWAHLIMACVADRETGFKHAIEIWRRLRTKTKPDIHHYNLLLRAARDCGLGSAEYANQLIRANNPLLGTHQSALEMKTDPTLQINKSLSGNNKELPQIEGQIISFKEPLQSNQRQENENKLIQLNDKCNETNIEKSETLVKPWQILPEDSENAVPILGPSLLDMDVPNILNPRGIKATNMISLGDVGTREARLALLGGLPGVLSHMRRDNVKPNIKTFSQLLDMMPSTSEAESDLLVVMGVNNVIPDVDFLNMVIQRRCKRWDLNSAKEALELFGKYKKSPTLMTFASLALGCKNHVTGLQLLRDIEEMGLVPTPDIFFILIRRCNDFKYLKALCTRMRRLGVHPDERTLNVIEDNIHQTRTAIVRKEKGLAVNYNFKRENLQDTFRDFMLFYKPWLVKMKLDVPPHPWDQFQRSNSSDPQQPEQT